MSETVLLKSSSAVILRSITPISALLGIPANRSVIGLKLSQSGRGESSPNVADKVKGAPSGSLKVLPGII